MLAGGAPRPGRNLSPSRRDGGRGDVVLTGSGTAAGTRHTPPFKLTLKPSNDAKINASLCMEPATNQNVVRCTTNLASKNAFMVRNAGSPFLKLSTSTRQPATCSQM